MAFGENAQKVDLHIDVVFQTGRVGGEEASPVRFRLGLRRAEVVLIIPPHEPIKVDRASVSRDQPKLEGTISRSVERKSQSGISAEGNVGISNSKGAFGSLGASLGGKQETTTDEKVLLEGQFKLMDVTQSTTADGFYRWLVSPRNGEKLDGRPWDAQEDVRLKIVDQRPENTKSVPPTVRVEVRCKKEDLLIEGIEIKNKESWKIAKKRQGFKNRMAAAEAYIRSKLYEEGLQVSNFEDVFGDVTIASAAADSE